LRLLFIRGYLPRDQPISNILAHSLAEDFDMWTHIAASLGDEYAEVVYFGGENVFRYSEKLVIRWCKSVDSFKPGGSFDAVFVRGGFKELDLVAQRFAFKKIRYGAGQRIIPEHGEWGVVLCDTEVQRQKLLNKGFNGVLWTKPAAPMFAPVGTPKTYDMCYVGDGRFPFRDDIKRVSWFYKHVPKELSVLHLGWHGKVKPPENVTVMRVPRSEMPLYYSKCRVLVVPYREYDSAPRVIPEALACGLNVVALDTVNFSNEKDAVYVTTKDKLWDTVRLAMNQAPKPYVTFNDAVEHLRKVLQ
jgi:hypothetical protein